MVAYASAYSRVLLSIILVVLFALLLCPLNVVAQDWTHLTPLHSPSAREFTVMTQFGDGSSVVLFGGFGLSNGLVSGDLVVNGDTWLWNGSDWSAYSPPTGSPPGRYWANMAYDPVSGNAVLFGGQSSPVDYLSDTWVFNRVCSTILNSRVCFGPVWSKVNSPLNPSARSSASMAYDPSRHRIVLTGGIDPAGVVTDTWEFDPATNSWAKSTVAGTTNNRNGTMTQCSNSGVPMQFGGATTASKLSNTSFIYEVVQGFLVWAPFTPSPRPIVRLEHGMAFYPVSGQDVMYAGDSCTQIDPNDCQGFLLSDTWSASCGPNGVTWKVQSPAHSPGLREGHVMSTGPNGLTVLMFGGDSFGADPSTTRNDTWVWGLRAACLPLDGSEIPANTKITCQFTPAEDIQFGGWETSGFAPLLGRQQNMNFEAVHPGAATISANWSDAAGSHSQTLHYTIVEQQHGH